MSSPEHIMQDSASETKTNSMQEKIPPKIVVEKIRQPILLTTYKGSNEKEGTDYGFLGKGSYSHTLPAVANWYALKGGLEAGGNILIQSIRLNNPFYWGDRGYGISNYLMGLGKTPPLIEKILLDAGVPKYDGTITRHGKRPMEEIANEASNIVTRELIKLGYDGVIAESEGGQEVLVFNQ